MEPVETENAVNLDYPVEPEIIPFNIDQFLIPENDEYDLAFSQMFLEDAPANTEAPLCNMTIEPKKLTLPEKYSEVYQLMTNSEEPPVSIKKYSNVMVHS